MACKLFCVLGLIFFGFSLASARVFYVDAPPNGLINPPRTSYLYPMNYPSEGTEQSSRDLDLNFSAGSPSENSDERALIYPSRKVFYSTPERPVYEMNRELETPVPYYKITDVPTRKIIYNDPELYPRRKIVKFNNVGPHKGEVVLELRVTANGNSNDGI